MAKKWIVVYNRWDSDAVQFALVNSDDALYCGKRFLANPKEPVVDVVSAKKKSCNWMHKSNKFFMSFLNPSHNNRSCTSSIAEQHALKENRLLTKNNCSTSSTNNRENFFSFCLCAQHPFSVLFMTSAWEINLSLYALRATKPFMA